MGRHRDERVIRMRVGEEPERPLSEEALAHAATSGDPEALAQLFDRLEPQVTAFLCRLVGGGADVEDLVQATFMTIAQGKTRFDGRSMAKTWVLGIAANLARRHLRSRARKARLSRALAREPERPRGAFERRVDARNELARVQAALDALPVSERAPLLLCELHGLSAKEAANALGTTEAAIWRRVSRARAAIRAATKEGEDA
jgi:RNA polymerase sigma-70 factor (ECF subfamily)